MTSHDAAATAGIGTLGSWPLDPLVLCLAVLLAGLYAGGLLRVRRAGVRWPWFRTVAFLGPGVGSLILVSMGTAAVWAHALFSAYAAQFMALLLVVPLLLALGRPLELALTALRAPAADRLRRALTNPAARLLTMPLLGPILLAVLPFVVFFSGVLPASLSHPLLLSVLHVLLFLVGAVVLVSLWETPMLHTRVPYALALLVAFIELLADAVPGIVIRLDTHVLALGHFTAAAPWASTPLHDQQFGGDLLWGFGEAVDLPFLILLLVQWARADAREAAAVDRALDARAVPPVPAAKQTAEAGNLARPGDVADTPEPAGGGVWQRPWWETDASVFGHRAGHYAKDAAAPPPPSEP